MYQTLKLITSTIVLVCMHNCWYKETQPISKASKELLFEWNDNWVGMYPSFILQFTVLSNIMFCLLNNDISKTFVVTAGVMYYFFMRKSLVSKKLKWRLFNHYLHWLIPMLSLFSPAKHTNSNHAILYILLTVWVVPMVAIGLNGMPPPYGRLHTYTFHMLSMIFLFIIHFGLCMYPQTVSVALCSCITSQLVYTEKEARDSRLEPSGTPLEPQTYLDS